MPELLDAAGLGRAINNGTFGHGAGADIFRMELLPEYAVLSDGDDFWRWRDGAAEPDRARKALTTDRLAKRIEARITSRRVRVLTAELTEYERYSCEWGYAVNGPAGEEIRVLRHGEHDVPALLGFDYWLLNGRTVLRMHYDDAGAFAGAEEALGLLRQVRCEHDAVWQAAEPFPAWWDRHGELRRQRV